MTDDEQTPSLAATLHQQLTTLSGAWSDTADPMNHGHGGKGGAAALPASTVVLRADITLTLAFWVHALIDEWPAVLQSLQPDEDGNLRLVVTETIDCTDVPTMCDLLDRELSRIVAWGDYGQTMADDLQPLVDSARLVSRPPRRDRMDVGECPDCGRSVRVKAHRWARLPVPTTDPDALPPWTEWQPAQDQLITCKGCGRRETLLGWRAVIVGPQRLLTADQLVEQIHAEFGERYSPVTIRVWARRGLIRSRGHSQDGRALYDRVQVFAALMDREATRRGA